MLYNFVLFNWVDGYNMFLKGIKILVVYICIKSRNICIVMIVYYKDSCDYSCCINNDFILFYVFF